MGNTPSCSATQKRPLKSCSIRGDISLLRQLVERGADLNISLDDDGSRPIHFVAKIYKDREHKKTQFLKRLTKAKADINAQNNFGLSALHYATQKDHVHAIRELLSLKADINITDRYGWTPLHYACKQGTLVQVQLFKEEGADMGALTRWKWTPVHVAARWGRTHILNELLKSPECVLHIKQKDESKYDAEKLAKVFAERDSNAVAHLQRVWEDRQRLLGGDSVPKADDLMRLNYADRTETSSSQMHFMTNQNIIEVNKGQFISYLPKGDESPRTVKVSGNQCQWVTCMTEQEFSGGYHSFVVRIQNHTPYRSVNQNIHDLDMLADIAIGCCPSDWNWKTGPTEKTYCYFGQRGSLSDDVGLTYGQGFSTGDIIRCDVNFDDRKIIFFRNGVSQGVAFTDVKGPLRFCVCMGQPESQVSILVRDQDHAHSRLFSRGQADEGFAPYDAGEAIGISQATSHDILQRDNITSSTSLTRKGHSTKPPRGENSNRKAACVIVPELIARSSPGAGTEVKTFYMNDSFYYISEKNGYLKVVNPIKGTGWVPKAMNGAPTIRNIM